MFSTKISALRVSLIQAGNLKKVQVKGSVITHTGMPGFQNCARSFSVLNKKSIIPTVTSVVLSKELSLICSITAKRWKSIHKITNNIKLYTEEPRKFEIDAKTLRLKQDHGNRPLVLMLPFLGAKQTHLDKFSKIHLDLGYDVLIPTVDAFRYMFPGKFIHCIAEDIVKFLSNNDYYEKLFIHGFSAGAFLWGICIMKIMKDLPKYQSLIDRIQAEAWDSLTNIHEVAYGISKTIFPTNDFMQKTIEKTLLLHLSTFYKSAGIHYKHSSDAFHHTKNVHAPSLVFLSKTDIVSGEAGIRRSIACLNAINVDTTVICFDKSPHVEHYRYHKEEYTRALMDHLRKVKMI